MSKYGKRWRDVLREHETFANFRWLKRWSKASPNANVAAIMQSGDSYHIVNCMGVVYADKNDLPYILAQLEVSVGMLKKEVNGR